MMCVRLTGCEKWTSRVGVASLGGSFYQFTSLEDCMRRCIETSSCISIDVSAVLCVVHTNTATSFPAPGYTEYRCVSPTQTYFRKCCSVYAILYREHRHRLLEMTVGARFLFPSLTLLLPYLPSFLPFFSFRSSSPSRHPSFPSCPLPSCLFSSPSLILMDLITPTPWPKLS